jgi:CheY-like chemotaxis protein
MVVSSDASAPTRNAGFGPETVLIVDDEIALRDAVAEFLAEEGYDVVTADDGRDALRHLRRGLRPCVILLDLMMRGMDGWEFRRQQVNDDDLKDIPVIVVSAAGLSDTRVKAQLGDVDVLPKPSSLEEILAAVHRRCRHPND